MKMLLGYSVSFLEYALNHLEDYDLKCPIQTILNQKDAINAIPINNSVYLLNDIIGLIQSIECRNLVKEMQRESELRYEPLDENGTSKTRGRFFGRF